MLTAPRLGCLNIHASLLPRWRGASPIQSAILAGDTKSGVTIMQMEAGLDTGPMLRADSVPITAATTASTLHDQLALMGAELVLHVLAEGAAPKTQPEEGVTYAPRLTREDGRINWQESATAIDRRIRALTPWPGTFTTLPDGTIIKIGAAALSDDQPHAPPGTILDDRLSIACGEGSIRLLALQRPGRGMMQADAFLRGQTLPAGLRLGEATTTHD